MAPTNEQILTETLLICVSDEVWVSDVIMVIIWSLSLIEGFSFGYHYAEPEDFDDNLPRAYDTLFEETLKRLESKGVHLRL